MDQHLKALCLEVLHENVVSERFNRLLLETGVRLDPVEWRLANKIIEKGDEIRHSVAQCREILQ